MYVPCSDTVPARVLKLIHLGCCRRTSSTYHPRGGSSSSASSCRHVPQQPPQPSCSKRWSPTGTSKPKRCRGPNRTKGVCGLAYIQVQDSSVLRVLCTVLDEAGLSCSAFGNCAVPVCNGAGACRCPAGQTFNGIDASRHPSLMPLCRPRVYAFSQ